MGSASRAARLLLSLSLLTFLAAAGHAAEPQAEAPLLPVSAEALGQGGSFMANAHGYAALFYNPAAFSLPERSLTILSTSAWVYADPQRFLAAVRGAGKGLAGFVEQESTTGGIGYGAAAGIGYVGHGLGLAAVLSLDSYLYGRTTSEVAGDLSATLAFVGGFSLPIHLWGAVVHLGGDLRPMFRVRVPLDYATFFELTHAGLSGGSLLTPLNDRVALHGFGFGIDLGTIVQLGDVRLALAARDVLGTRFRYSESTVGDILDSLRASQGLPEGTVTAQDYVVPMTLAAGVSYHLDVGSLAAVLDPTVHASVEDLIAAIQGKSSFWTLLHLGAELKILRRMALRGGYNEGYLTAGVGVKLPLLEVNAAVFTREMGREVGERPSSGLSVEAALRI